MAPKSRARSKKEPTPEPSSSDSSDSSEKVEQETKPQNSPDHDLEGDDEDQATASESESEPGEPQYELKPVSGPSKKRNVEPSPNVQGTPKRSKTDEKKTTPGGSITRLWSEADEISLLNGMLEFKNQKGSLPRNVKEYETFVKGKLSMTFSVGQIRTKLRRMRGRFSTAFKKRQDGKDPVFSDPHELEAYEISKKIWGNEVGNVEVNDSLDNDNEEEDDAKEIDAEDCEFWSKYPHLSASFENVKGDFPTFAGYGGAVSSVMARLELIGHAKAKELDGKWKELLKEEMELHYRKMGLMIEQVKLALD